MIILRPTSPEGVKAAISCSLSFRRFGKKVCVIGDIKPSQHQYFDEVNTDSKGKEIACLSLCVSDYDKLTKKDIVVMPDSYTKIAPLVKGKKIITFNNLSVPAFNRFYQNECKKFLTN